MERYNAIVCETIGSIDNLVLKNIARTRLGKKQVRVQVKACGVNFPDKLMVEGKYQFKPSLPFTPGLEIAGKVIETHSSSNFLVGDKVTCQMRVGGYSEELIVPEESLENFPDQFSYDEAAGFRVAAQTAFVALIERANLKTKQSVMVLGAAGGVGSAAVQLAKSLGSTVIAVANTSEKQKFCKSLGADFVLGYENLKVKLLELTNNHGIDIVYDPVGGDIFRESLSCLTWGGKYLIIGFANGSIPLLPTNIALIKGVDIMGVRAGEYFRRFPHKKKNATKRLSQIADSGSITPRIHTVLPLSQAIIALKMIEHREVMGRIILKPNE